MAERSEDAETRRDWIGRGILAGVGWSPRVATTGWRSPLAVFSQMRRDSSRKPRGATIRINFNSTVETSSLSGGLLGIDSGERPSDERITGIRPALWRGHPAIKDRMQRLGARFEILMSEDYGYPPDYKGKGPPFLDWAAYEGHVRRFVDAYPDDRAIWEPWNEPDLPQFWSGSLEQYHELYARTYRILRARFGDSLKVAGPSLAFDTPEKIRAFLEACLRNRVQVNVLTLHLLRFDDDIPGVESALKGVKTLLKNPRYRPLQVRDIHVNEIVGAKSFLQPGDNLAYLRFAERGGATGACKGCWKDSSGQESCFNHTLAGLLTRGSFEPRSVWWAYHAYAAGASTRVDSGTPVDGYIALASRAGAFGDGPQVILARYADKSPVVPKLEVQGLSPWSGERTLMIRRLPSSGEEPLTEPVLMEAHWVSVSKTVQSLTLPEFAPHEAIILTLAPRG